MRAFVRRAFDWFGGLTATQRALLFPLVGAVNISIVFGVLNTFAVYLYAYYAGIRLPVEGVPYLRVAIAVTAFAIFSISGLVAAVFWLFFRALDNAASSPRSPGWVLFMRILSVVAPLVGLIGTITGLIATFKALTNLPPIEDIWNLESWIGPGSFASSAFDPTSFYSRAFRIGIDDALNVTILGLLAAICALALFMLTNVGRETRKMVFAWTGSAFVVISVVGVFNPVVYGSFLREIRFGGGTPVELTYRSTDGTLEQMVGGLLMSSNSSVTLRDNQTGMITEISHQRVSKVVYLPDIVSSEE